MFFKYPWAALAAKRIGAGIIVGAITTAIVGALCVGAAGALLGAILDIRSTPATWDGGFMGPGLFLGLHLGAWSGIWGAIVGGVAAFGARPGALLAPLSILKRVALGQLLATLGALSFYLILALVIAHVNGRTFVAAVEENLVLAIFGGPILMNCGAIVGALFKRADTTMMLAAE